MGVGELMHACAELAAIMGANAMNYYRSNLATEIKNDGSPVTVADRSSERLARDWLEHRFPSDGIVGEEYGTTRAGAKRSWIIDPVDGTKSFVRKIPFWGSLVAVVEGDDILAGAVSFPALEEMLVAALGEGCWWNDSRASVSTVSDLASATVLTTDPAFKADPGKLEGWLSLSNTAGICRAWGDCVGYLLVATGRAEVMVDPVVSAWDIAPMLPAIVEAGGVFTDWSGKVSVVNRSAIATNAALAKTTRRILTGGAQ